MNEKIVIGVDTGNRCIKTVDFSFVAGIKKHIMKPALTSDDCIKYKGSYYTLTSKRLSYLENKAVNDDYFVLSLFAIAKELKLRNVDLSERTPIHIGIGLPPSHIGRLQNEFISYFKRNYIQFEYNGQEIEMSIENVSLFPQGFAAIVQQMDQIVPISKSYIIDIGGYTTDVILLKKGIPDMEFCESLPFGVIQLYNNIKSMAELEFGRVPDESQIDYVLETGEELYLNMSQRINDVASEYIDNLMRTLYELGVDLILSHGIFVGGGSLRLKESLKTSPYVKKKIFIPNINANAAGYEFLIKNT